MYHTSVAQGDMLPSLDSGFFFFAVNQTISELTFIHNLLINTQSSDLTHLIYVFVLTLFIFYHKAARNSFLTVLTKEMAYSGWYKGGSIGKFEFLMRHRSSQKHRQRDALCVNN